MSDLKISQLTTAGMLNPDALVPVVQPDPSDGGIMKNFTVKASQFSAGSGSVSSGGVQLLGKLLGANMNLASIVSLKYSGHTGFVFQAGDTIKSANGASATVVSNDGSILTLSTVVTGMGNFNMGGTITGSIGQISYGSLSGSFSSSGGLGSRGLGGGSTSQTITDNTSGASATMVTDGMGAMTISNITGTFVMGDSILGKDTGATAVVSGFTAPGTATIEEYSVSDGDQAITLSGGSTYIITDIVLTNATTTLTNASGAAVYTGTQQSGFQIAFVSGNMNLLTSAANFFNKDNGVIFNSPSLGSSGNIGQTGAPVTNASPIYFSLGTPQGSAAKVDIYVFGYVLN